MCLFRTSLGRFWTASVEMCRTCAGWSEPECVPCEPWLKGHSVYMCLSYTHKYEKYAQRNPQLAATARHILCALKEVKHAANLPFLLYQEFNSEKTKEEPVKMQKLPDLKHTEKTLSH